MSPALNRFQALLSIPLLLLVGCQSQPVVESSTEETSKLVEFASPAGQKRFDSAKAKVDFFTLANQFEGQSNGLFCGPTSIAIVLNALRSGKKDLLPKDRSRIKKADLRYLPNGVDPAVSRYTQETVFLKSPKSRAKVFGKPTMLKGKKAKDFGLQLSQLSAVLKQHGLNVKTVPVADDLAESKVLEDLVENLKRPGDYVLINYKRTAVGQEGGGHISPVAAYDANSRSFLVLDVNPSKANWVWVPQDTLVQAMRTFDTLQNRGYVLVSEGS